MLYVIQFRNNIKSNQTFREVLLSTIQTRDDITKSRMKQGLIACKLYDFPAFTCISWMLITFLILQALKSVYEWFFSLLQVLSVINSYSGHPTSCQNTFDIQLKTRKRICFFDEMGFHFRTYPYFKTITGCQLMSRFWNISWFWDNYSNSYQCKFSCIYALT